ncbi:MAG: metal ABC transporter substrate-binding protein, partial [Chloroflexi bacterium]|nr:metal ABC transporter substrate-binding protein [Chloroflexota bacterium]
AGRLRVATTVSPLTSIAESIGGDRIELTGIIPEGVNSHTFEPPPSVARTLADADLIVINGLRLEEPALDLARANKREQAVILLLGDQAISRADWVFDFSFPESGGRPNPHLWTDPLLALRYGELIAEQLVALDGANAAYYRANLAAFEARIHQLDAAIREAVATIPRERRLLLTYHDSFPYFAQRYGFEVLGAVQPSNFSEPSPREVARLIEQVIASEVPVIFGSEVFASDVLETIAAESGARYVDQLRDDDLPGDRGDPRHSYLGLMVANVEIIVRALGGDASAVSAFDASPVFEGARTASSGR